MSRRDDIERFYDLLDELVARVGGPRRLAFCTAKTGWPSQGVYFFFEDGEVCDDGRLRVVRVGTHALVPGSRTTLWQRLSQHRGQVGGRRPGHGDHRGSDFRWHVGTALLAKGDYPDAVGRSWLRSKVSREELEAEYPVERAVSAQIGSMPLLWVAVPDRADGGSDRGMIERNAAALLSAPGVAARPSSRWLGSSAAHPQVPACGLWNVNHVDEPYDPRFLDVLSRYVRRTGAEGRTQECEE